MCYESVEDFSGSFTNVKKAFMRAKDYVCKDLNMYRFYFSELLVKSASEKEFLFFLFFIFSSMLISLIESYVLGSNLSCISSGSFFFKYIGDIQSTNEH